MKKLFVVIVALSCSSLAFAQGKDAAKDKPAAAAAAPAKDAGKGADKATAAPAMGAAGPWTRKPKDEKAVKKEIDAFFKEEEELMKKGDFDASIPRYDFPVFMATDDAKGTVETKLYSRDEFVAMMKPMMESMPKDMKMTHKPNVVVLSDVLASVTDDFTMTVGKEKLSGKNHALLVKVGGKWKWKTMTEAGWGGMSGSAPAK
ncbi:MAG TPA: hypothetical protein VK420_00255 [Longimicrobium sp.]|nr:hypothetical protein [Longimicrobium sp.]